jgi:hypothetical protein
MNGLVTQIFLADPPRKPKQKAATVIIFFLVAAGALFIATAAFGIYTRNPWTAAVRRRTNEAARMRMLTELEVPNPTGELSSGSYVQITLDIPVSVLKWNRALALADKVTR